MKWQYIQSELKSQYRGFLSTLLKIYASVILLILISVMQSKYTGFTMRDLMADPYALTNSSPFFGFISNLGVLILCSTSSICLFTASVVRKNNNGAKSDYYYFLVFSGMVALVLTLDDWLAIHEEVPYSILSLFIEFKRTKARQNFLEFLTFAVYGMAILLYLYRFRKIFLQKEYLILLFAFVFFALSLIFDFLPIWQDYYVPEEGCKLLGIVTFSAFYIRACQQRIHCNNYEQPAPF